MSKYPMCDYNSNGRDYLLCINAYQRNYYNYGDDNTVEVEFPIYMIDKKTNCRIYTVYYKYRSNKYGKDLSVDKQKLDEGTLDYILTRDGAYCEPEFPGEDVILPLFDKYLDYMSNELGYSVDKTLFSSETSICIF